MERAARGVHRDRVVVDAEAVALGVAVGKEPPLQHLVRREADARYNVRRVEGRLLDLGEVVLWVLVQIEDAHLDERVVLVKPDLGQVERVVRALGRVLFGHHLNEHLPAGEVALLDAVVEVTLVALATFADHGFGFGIGQVLDALLGVEVELHPVPLVLRVDEAEGVAAEHVHMSVAERDAALAHGDRDLVQRLGQRGPEVPVVLRAAQVGARVTLHRMVEVRELERVAQEEDRCVVANKVPVALLGVELNRGAADIALRVGRAALAGHRREAQEEVGLLADRREELGLGVLGDVMGHREGTVGA